jgi:hypothetical protein
MLIDNTDEMYRGLAYTVGNLLGDGSLSANTRIRKAGSVPRLKTDRVYVQCSVRFGSLDIETLERVQSEIEKCFGKKHPIFTRKLKSGRDFHNLTACSREVFDFLAVCTSMKSRIPEWYYTADDETKRSLIAGLMDTDGYISQRDFENYSRWTVGFGMNERPIVEGAASILQSIGAKVGTIGTSTKGAYRSLHRFQVNASAFSDAGCYFVARRKQKKLLACMSYRQASETSNDAPLIG